MHSESIPEQWKTINSHSKASVITFVPLILIVSFNFVAIICSNDWMLLSTILAQILTKCIIAHCSASLEFSCLNITLDYKIVVVVDVQLKAKIFFVIKKLITHSLSLVLKRIITS